MDNMIQQQNVTLANSLLDVMEQTATAELKRVISSIRAIMQLPDCVELFSTCIINSTGGRIPISHNTIHKAVDCLIRIEKENIERLPISTNEKDMQKSLISSWMHYCEYLLVNTFHQQGLLKV